MNWKTKGAIALVLLAAVAFIGFREFKGSCGPAPKADEHGHSHGASEQHTNEGFATKVCEEGLIVALRESVGFAETTPAKATAPAKTEPAESAVEAGHKEGEKGGSEESEGHAHDEKEAGGEGFITLSNAQVQAAELSLASVAVGKLAKEIAVPGRIAINANAQAKIVPKLSGTVARIEKLLGEQVAAGDLLAVIESREMADAKADYLASLRAEELARSVFEREQRLWKQKITAEQDYLTARNAQQGATIKLDVAHQKLHTIGLTDDEIAALSKVTDGAQYRSYEIRSPIAGSVTARDVVLGQTVGTDREIFTIAEIAKVWVEMAIAPGDLGFAREGLEVRVEAGSQTGTGKIIALSPLIDPETRSAKAIAELDNAGSIWKLGDYVNARLVAADQDARLIVPNGAIQTIEGKKVVFVSEKGGFRARPITTGHEDSKSVEIISGVKAGEEIATSNTFTLKAELGKSEAEHEH